MKKLRLLCVLSTLVFIATIASAQSPYWKTADNGKQILITPGALPPVHFLPGNSITTTFASDNGYAGNMFDLEVIGSKAININSIDVNIAIEESPTCEIRVYYRTGSYVGYESSSNGWVLASSVAGVIPQGEDNHTFVNIDDFTMQPGQTYGIYVTVYDYPSARMSYTDGNNVYTDANLRITAGIGKGEPVFTGTTFTPRTWNGTIYYTESNAVPFPYWSILVVFGLIAGYTVIRFRGRIF